MAYLKSFTHNNKLGYKDEDGKIIIQPQFDEGTGSFGTDCYNNSRYGSVSVNGQCGIINEDGEIVVALEYEEAIPLFGDLFAIRKASEAGSWICGVINAKKEVIIPFEYKAIYSTKNFVKCYKKASSKRYFSSSMTSSGRVYEYSLEAEEYWFNQKGHLIFKGNGVCEQSGLLTTQINNKLGIIDENGNKIIDNTYDEIHCASSNRFVVRLNDDKDGWACGVIGENNIIIIPFDYKFIDYSNPHFFECFSNCSCKVKFNQGYEYSSKKNPNWFNSNGKQLYSGNAKILNEYHLAVEKGQKWGVLNHDGQQLVNFIYDFVDAIFENIVVGINGKVGILGHDGHILINPSYEKIECVCTSNEEFCGPERWLSSKPYYGQYSLKNIFSTSDCGPYLDRKTISIKNKQNPELSIQNGSRFNLDKILILYSKEFSELFSVSDGIIPNSRFDKISQLTDISYAVKRGNYWGVFRSDSKELSIPCEYEQIVFEGGNIVYLQKNNLWGARTLISSPLSLNKLTDIPLSFLEIKALDQQQSLYGVKVIRKGNAIDEYATYTIVDISGKECLNNIYERITSQFTLYRQDRILCSVDGKYGFISLDGYVSIPFKYDEIKERKDEKFDIRIDNKWGVLSLDKGEEVAVKYAQPIPSNCKSYNGIVVTDAMTGRKGILSKTGDERIPAIYEHIIPKGKFTFFGRGGYEDGAAGNFFANIDYGIWGCLDENGQIIIPQKYDCIIIQGDFFLAGRDGTMLYRDDNCYGSDYSGVYDLYDKSGNIIIGGFRKFEYLDDFHLYKFFFGGFWQRDQELLNEWNNIYVDDYHFEEDRGRWIVTTKDLTSIKRPKSGKVYTLKKNTSILTVKEEGPHKTQYWNCPLDILIEKEPYAIGDYILVHGEKESFAIRICDGQETPKYEAISFIGNNKFFVQNKNKVGLVDFNGKNILPIEYIAFTMPINSYFFGVKEDNGNYNVDLFDLKNEEIQSYRAITQSPDILERMSYSALLISIDNAERGLKSISVPIRNIFDESFKNIISDKENDKHKIDNSVHQYWFSNSFLLRNHRKASDNTDYGREAWDEMIDEYRRDTWDAMTDGMYGDMPDGFDGDYDFLR